MHRRISNLGECVPGGFKYVVPETGQSIGPFIVYRDLESAVRKYYALSGLLSPGDLEARIHEYICASIPEYYCRNEDGTIQLQPQARSGPAQSQAVVKFGAVVQGTLTLSEWLIKGRLLKQAELVGAEQSLARAGTCAACSHNVPIGGCAKCVAGRLEKAVVAIVGNNKTPLDDRLQACDLCGCALKAKVWLPLDLLRKRMTVEQLLAFPPHCWLVTEAKL